MLKCVPLSKVANSSVPQFGGNSFTLALRRWSNHHRRYLTEQVDLRPYMEKREAVEACIESFINSGAKPIKLTKKMKKDMNWERTYHMVDDILGGVWVMHYY